MNKILILYTDFPNQNDIKEYYGKKFNYFGLDSICEFTYIRLDTKSLTSTTKIRNWLDGVKDIINTYDYILCTDNKILSAITKQPASSHIIGKIYSSPYIQSKLLRIKSIYSAKFDTQLFHEHMNLTCQTLLDSMANSYIELGSDVIHSASHPSTVEEIEDTLKKIKDYPELAVDIETKSLKITEAGIYSIAFAWDSHNGVAFFVDALNQDKVRTLLREFFDSYQGKLIVHKANYDISILVYCLYMKEDFTDIPNQLLGINTLCKNLDDTLLISYLATNNTQGNSLSLKEKAATFAGNWAVDVSDVTKVEPNELLKYNLIDVCSTHYVRNKYYPIMVQDNQEEIYKEHFLPYLKDCIRMQLNGLPIDLDYVNELEINLNQEKNSILGFLAKHECILSAEDVIAELQAQKRNSKLKIKKVTAEDCHQSFNFNSNQHLNVLFYTVMDLPILDTTQTGLPSTSSKTIQKLLQHTENQEYKDILLHISHLSDVEKILSAFIPAFKNASKDKYGNVRLNGYFHLGGTVSGRMSSTEPNLQQLPATGSRFAKAVKRCFRSNDEWILCGIDFASLEDKIDALKTRDENKLKVYLEGYDGHCLRAFYYFKDKMPDIVEEYNKALTNEDKVKVINSISSKYKELRQLSKAPSFALTYDGTHHTLMNNCGFSKEEALKIEESYHQLYVQSDEWKKEKIKQAIKDGYVTGAFGLRVRTPLLKDADFNRLNPQESAEARTAGNALGQGWGLLNNRALNAVLKRVDEANLSEFIYPVASVHDASYYMIRNNLSLITWFNQVVSEEALWNNHETIFHEQVQLGGQLDLYYPSWKDVLTLPNKLSKEELKDLINNFLKETK